MKIKVLTLKDICKYLAKIVLIFSVIAIFANFFNTNKNTINSYFTFNSSKFLSVMKNEILLLRGKDELQGNFTNKKYSESTINNELNVFSVVANTNSNENIPSEDTNDATETVENENNSSASSDIPQETVNTISNEQEGLPEADTNVTTEVLPSNVPDKATYEVFGVEIRDECDYNMQEEIKDLDININKNDILIFHTHTCESYTPTEQYQYDATGNFRTTDLNYSVARVGDELEKYLTNYGYSIIHDKSYHDYPSYNGSYDRSLITVKNILSTSENTDVVIDLHRDAIGDNTYAPTVKIGEDYCARLMFVVGTDGGGLKHDNWRENVKFAIKMVQKGNELYPRIV